MDRVVIVGRGGSGKSVLAKTLGSMTGIPVIELDNEFWDDELAPRRPAEWIQRQTVLAAEASWIMDGDLGPHDVLEPRLRNADTVIILDLPLWLCALRATRRGKERRDFWRWVLWWRRESRPELMAAIATHAPQATVVDLDSRSAVDRWLNSQGN